MKNAEYARKSAELEKQYEAQTSEINAKMATIEQRLVVAPVLKALAELCQDELLSLDFKPDELVKLLLQDEADRTARAAMVEDVLANANDVSCKGKLLYVLFGATGQEKWK